jgi:saccharopine dehydrogenase-like NADP-dependent oxidoreductase
MDLATGHALPAADVRADALKTLRDKGVETHSLDLADEAALRAFVAGFDVIVSAVPSKLGYRTLSTLVDAGCRIADIAFTPEDVLQLDARAKQTGAMLLTDIGVAPGISNLILGHHDAHMQVKKFLCYVGGNPRKPRPPFKYRATFATSDVIEEYTRPARIQRNGEIVELPALTEREMVNFEGVGEMEAFLTDGLRSILVTMPHIPEMIEKTMRWPGHVDIVEAMRDAGYFSLLPIEVNGRNVVPHAVTVALLKDEWRMQPGEEDMIQMRVIVEGEQDGKQVRHTWETQDNLDPESGFSAMSRTTGFTCAAAANLLAEGLWHEAGVHPAERVGRNEIAQSVPVDDQYEFQREYPEPLKYAHVTGYFSFYNQTGIEQTQNQVLAGDDPRLFVTKLVDLISNKSNKGGSVKLTLHAGAQQAA